MKLAASLALLLATAALAVWYLMPPTQAAAQPGELSVVELYQSQGCSSCPPANENVAAISDRPDILALSFAVTYWDQLGWRDTFAKREYTQRQYDYQRGLELMNVYTPQVIINGRTDLSAVHRNELDAAVARVQRVNAGPLSITNATLTIRQTAPGPAADVWLVRYDRRVLQVPINAGENNGRTLPHKNIVRELTHLGTWNGAAASFPLLPSADPNFASAVLLQKQNGGPILAAVKF